MEAHEILAGATGVWAIAMAVSPGLQIRQMYQTGQSEDVSIGYFAVLVVGFVLWVAYGISIGNMVLAVPNAVATVFGVATIAYALRLRRRNARADAPHLPESGT